ncbi:MAG: hypothetical protein ACFFAU_10970 [Candidatus Hodarchaeota archaeon]
MFSIKDQEVLIPIYGPKKIPKINFKGYLIKIEKKLDRLSYKDELINLCKLEKEKGIYCFTYDNNLIIPSNYLQDKSYTPSYNQILMKEVNFSQFEYPKLIRVMLSDMILERYCEEIQYRDRSFIFEGEKVEQFSKANITIDIIRHNAIRFSIYLDQFCTSTAIMIYPSFRFSLSPSLDILINSGIDVINLHAHSLYSEIDSGKIKDILIPDHSNYMVYNKRLKTKYKQKEIPYVEKSPLILIESPRSKRDAYESSNVYSLQVQFTDFYMERLGYNFEDLLPLMQLNEDQLADIFIKYQTDLAEVFDRVLKD